MFDIIVRFLFTSRVFVQTRSSNDVHVELIDNSLRAVQERKLCEVCQKCFHFDHILPISDKFRRFSYFGKHNKFSIETYSYQH